MKDIHREEGFFLITNKHVLAANKTDREKAFRIILHLNIKDANLLIHKQEAKIYLKTESIRHFREPDVDVLAFDVTGLLVQYHPQIQNQVVTYDMFADTKKRAARH